MTRTRMITAALFGLLAFGLAAMPGTAYAEKRIALVIGNAGYQAGALNTPANDAGLIAQTLQAAGFDVAGARDPDQDSLRHASRDFVEKATASGPDTVAFVYGLRASRPPGVVRGSRAMWTSPLRRSGFPTIAAPSPR